MCFGSTTIAIKILKKKKKNIKYSERDRKRHTHMQETVLEQK